MTDLPVCEHGAGVAGGAVRCFVGARTLGGLAAVLLALAAPRLTAQQVQSSVVFGGVRVRYADALDVNAFMISPAVTLQSDNSVVGVTGTISQPSLGPWSAQGQLAVSVNRALASRFALEVGGLAGGSTTGDGTRTGNAQALVRGHVGASRAGLWLGGGAGTAWNGAGWQPTRLTEAGVWAQSERVGIVATITPTVANDSVRYADSQLSLRLRGARVEVDGVLGHRSGGARGTGYVDPSDWASVNMSIRVSARTAIVASGGAYPLDLLQGFPAGRFVSLGLRLTGPGSGPSPEFARTTEELGADRLLRSRVGAVVVRRVAGGRYELRLRASGAERMEIMGDLTGWEPVAMQAAPDGWWSLVLDGAPGTHEIALRRDRGVWVVPPGLVERTDEFGSAFGIITLR